MSGENRQPGNNVSSGLKSDTGKGTEIVGGYGKIASEGLLLTDKPLEFKKTFFQLIKSLSLYKYLIIVASVFAVTSTVFVIFGPMLMAELTDMIFNGVTDLLFNGNGIDKTAIYLKLLQLFFLYLISSLFMYAQGFIMASVAQKVSLKMRGDINKKISRLPVAYFDKHSHGDVLSRITNDVDTVGNTLNQGLTQIITAVSTIIGIAVMLFTISVPLALTVIAILPLSYIIIAVIAKKSQKHFREQQNYLGAANGSIEEMYGGHSVVKAFGMEKRSAEKFKAVNEKLYGASKKAQTISGFIDPFIVFVGNLGYVAVIVFGAYLSIAGAISPGELYACIQYVKSFTLPINQTAQISNVIQSTVAAAERIYVFLDSTEETRPEEPQKMPEAADIRGDIRFENVSFAYEENVPVINNLNLDIASGSRVAIVGKTGSGKTTVIKLLMRFYDPKTGRVLLDGADIALYDKKEYRENIAMVLQDTWLFNGSIKENIRYGRRSATDEEVKEAAVAAGADRFISAMKDGYDSLINEEADNLSEGEKQLLSIARAVIKKSRIIILDEATSSIDTLTERIVQDAVEKITKDKTCFVIAHRLSTIINSDLILVMQDGELAESGTHTELLSKRGLYAEMYNTQFSK
ncbi:MAG: ABC transporter ATP-binding protein/permease [Clostridiales bacterium]|jgi:ATP-binding cassette subfamily B protein|nr:ABC transporter ATP-binding protein/permease [Clostridiales bacterium]